MVSRDYMLEKRPLPPAWKRTLDLTVLPALITVVTMGETAAEQVAVQVRRHPVSMMSGGAALGCGLAMVLLGRRSVTS